MKNERRVVNALFGTYTVFLLEGFTLKIYKKIVVSTIRECLAAVNEHYEDNGFKLPYARNDNSQADKLL